MQAFEKAAHRAATLVELNALFGRAVRECGFTAYAAGYLPHGNAGAKAARDPFVLINWPRAWLELYARQGFAGEDAVIAAAQHAAEPFTWKQVQASQPGASARIFAAAREFGWSDGLLVPVRDPADEGRVGVVSLATPGLDHLDAAGLDRVAALCRFAFVRALGLSGESVQPPSLTAREREVLMLVARGYDDAGIGAALGLTKATAHSYVERAKRRLGAATRAQAVATALLADLIDLRGGA
ncbi:autoinducer binding domain-containing protein [uncultured Methylobacterium sp.]|uniref:helix-turn-helix transcriptional regulator n=1 Tax=uncultured Methylobacterium sp. TaxID=157278 RepID=UPI0035C9FB89